jgi:25S rRNA (adenine2142-N1)-methyltransferase
MLEIGALTPRNYATCPWIDNYPIDLNSQHTDIVEQDFLQRPLPKDETERFDIISCSLVLNFVSEPQDRGANNSKCTNTGRMLSLIHAQLRPNRTSLLFLVLPLPCLSNSRYISISSMQALMAIIGFELVADRWKEGGKVGYWLWAWREPGEGDGWRKRVVETDGPKRNNFSILLCQNDNEE